MLFVSVCSWFDCSLYKLRSYLIFDSYPHIHHVVNPRQKHRKSIESRILIPKKHHCPLSTANFFYFGGAPRTSGRAFAAAPARTSPWHSLYPSPTQQPYGPMCISSISLFDDAIEPLTGFHNRHPSSSSMHFIHG